MIQKNEKLHIFLTQLVESKKYDEKVKFKTFSRNECVIKQGGNPRFIYFIRKGLVKCFIEEDNGRTYLIDFFGEGKILGELEILTRMEYFTSIQTVTEAVIIQIDANLFQEIMNSDNEFKSLILNDLVERLVELAKKSSFQQVYPVEQSIQKILKVFNENKTMISKNDLANYLVITLRTLNRSLKNLNLQIKD